MGSNEVGSLGLSILNICAASDPISEAIKEMEGINCKSQTQTLAPFRPRLVQSPSTTTTGNTQIAPIIKVPRVSPIPIPTPAPSPVTTLAPIPVTSVLPTIETGQTPIIKTLAPTVTTTTATSSANVDNGNGTDKNKNLKLLGFGALALIVLFALVKKDEKEKGKPTKQIK